MYYLKLFTIILREYNYFLHKLEKKYLKILNLKKIAYIINFIWWIIGAVYWDFCFSKALKITSNYKYTKYSKKFRKSCLLSYSTN